MVGTSFETMGGISTVVNTYRDVGLFDRWPIYYVATHRDGTRVQKLTKAVRAFFTFLWLLCSHNVRLLHVHSSSRSSFWRKTMLMVPCFLLRVPVIFHLHGSEFMIFYEDESSRLSKALVRAVLERTAVIVGLSTQWKEQLETVVSQARVITILNPAPAEIMKVSPGSREGNKLLFMGRLGRRKGIYDLLEALKPVREKHEDFVLLCGGDGDLEGVAEMAGRFGLKENVKILGWISGKDKERLFSKADIFLLPSYDEGLPMSVLEAMAASLPVITTPVGGIPDAIEDGCEGIMIQPGDVDALAGAVTRLLDDSALRIQMGRAGRKKAEEKFSPENIVMEVEDIYREFWPEGERGTGTIHGPGQGRS